MAHPVTPPAVSVGLTYARAPRPEWTWMLDTIAPRSDVLSWLTLRWEAGDTWEPIERWVVWQMRPKAIIRPEILEELEGPHPRSAGHYCTAGQCECHVKQESWVGSPCVLIDRETWELYRETGHYGTRWWVVQGDQGGHRVRWSAAEARLSKNRGGPSRPPVMGTLPYAEPDRRTWAAIGERDKLRKYALLTDFLQRSPSIFDAEERAEAEEAADALWQSLQREIGAVVSDVAPVIRDAMRQAPRLIDARAQAHALGDLDEARQQFITDLAGSSS